MYLNNMEYDPVYNFIVPGANPRSLFFHNSIQLDNNTKRIYNPRQYSQMQKMNGPDVHILRNNGFQNAYAVNTKKSKFCWITHVLKTWEKKQLITDIRQAFLKHTKVSYVSVRITDNYYKPHTHRITVDLSAPFSFTAPIIQQILNEIGRGSKIKFAK